MNNEVRDHGIPLRRGLFIDERPGEKSVGDYRLILGPDNDGELRVYRCNEPTRVKPGSKLIVLKSGAGIPWDIEDDDRMEPDSVMVRSMICQLVGPDEPVEDIDAPVWPFPEHLADVHIPERSEWTDDDLGLFYMSLNLGDSGKGVEDGSEKESLMRKLGKISKRIF